ncbi:WD40-like Beta Propeller Repeat [Amycolatopsis xylanica]|uniref:WD40-like Beta Propeller Repeat n=1 Tax=Amycolatopsis xylanica TaxID=589385 RepID=A0A1H3QT97_9PSEU|nr:PD40 domain-containing protein [Amycolatopsis xylanica]SDZ16281.1 WD40-like Beta Propeller Repeat [Amycolatopsis xylanica]
MSALRPVLATAGVLAGLLVAAPASAAAPVIQVVSRTQAAEGNDSSSDPATSADGRYVVFASYATNFIPGNTNGSQGIYVKDTVSGVISHASAAANGTQADADSEGPSISADGRYVAFSSLAANLVPGDTNGARDIFVKDIRTGAIVKASTAASDFATISADGKHVSFRSGTNAYVKNLDTGELKLIVATAPATPYPLSADGRFAVFTTTGALVAGDTNGKSDVYLKDLQTGTLTRISTTATGGQSTGGATAPAISADGRFAAFESAAADLVPADTNGASDVFVKDLAKGTIRIGAVAANGATTEPKLSADGRYLAFASSATNLVPGDTNGVSDVFVKDLSKDTVIRTSVAAGGAQADEGSDNVDLSGNGRVTVFRSEAANLVPADGNHVADIFSAPALKPGADPYADAIAAGTTVGLSNGANALGAPDGKLAGVTGLLGGRLVLDMGEDEEGTGDLAVYYGGLNLGLLTSLDFLDAQGKTVGSGQLKLIDLGAGTHVAKVPHSGAPYRYVRINTGLLQVFSLDAVEAAG